MWIQLPKITPFDPSRDPCITLPPFSPLRSITASVKNQKDLYKTSKSFYSKEPPSINDHCDEIFSQTRPIPQYKEENCRCNLVFPRNYQSWPQTSPTPSHPKSKNIAHQSIVRTPCLHPRLTALPFQRSMSQEGGAPNSFNSLKSQREPKRIRLTSHVRLGKRDFNLSPEIVNYAIQPALPGILPPPALCLIDHIYPTIVKKKYSAPSLDPINPSLLVFEYPIGQQFIIWNYCTGMVHLTSLWRAAIQEGVHGPEYGIDQYTISHQRRLMQRLIKPNAKADITRLLESTPQNLHSSIKRVRGGFLKIQGTWIDYSLCKRLATRFAYYIRFHLVPIFGADFPDLCLLPSNPKFCELELDCDFLRSTYTEAPLMAPFLPLISSQLQSSGGDMQEKLVSPFFENRCSLRKLLSCPSTLPRDTSF